MAETDLTLLREEVFARDGGCVWPGCTYKVSGVNPLQLAHLEHRGMGGSKSRNTAANCVMLCRWHHDCLDGRTGLGTLRFELNEMLRAVTEGLECSPVVGDAARRTRDESA